MCADGVEVHINLVPATVSEHAARLWESGQFVITPELLGMRSAGECQQRAERLGFTPLPWLPRHQEHWRLDVLLAWSRTNGLDRLPSLGQGFRPR